MTKQREYYDINALSNVLSEWSNILIFHGKKSFENISDIILPLLKDKQVVSYSNFSVNPQAEELNQAFAELGSGDYDAIVAIGGGSVIDFAKLFKFKYITSMSLEAYFDGEECQYYKQIPLIAIPTTAGTGAEATQFAVIYLSGQKKSLEDVNIMPDVAIIDYKFLTKLPRYLKACTAMDAFCQALESYWSVNANEQSMQYSKKAILLCRDYLVNFVNKGNAESCRFMAQAAHLSGCAINIAKTTVAHALSYYITSHYNIPHGHAVALSIRGLFEANLRATLYNIQAQQNINHVRNKMNNLLGLLEIDEVSVFKFFEDLMSDIGLEYQLSKLNIDDIDNIVNSINPERMKNNPVYFSSDELKSLFLQ